MHYSFCLQTHSHINMFQDIISQVRWQELSTIYEGLRKSNLPKVEEGNSLGNHVQGADLGPDQGTPLTSEWGPLQQLNVWILESSQTRKWCPSFLHFFFFFFWMETSAAVILSLSVRSVNVFQKIEGYLAEEWHPLSGILKRLLWFFCGKMHCRWARMKTQRIRRLLP